MILGYCDGACKGNPGIGGWGWAYKVQIKSTDLWYQDWGYEKYTTNNKMELTAMIRLLENIPFGSSATIYTDSKYVSSGMILGGKHGTIDSLTGYISSWIKNGWQTTSKTPVNNKDLWERIIVLCKKHTKKFSNITIKWVKGHSDNEGNQLADDLANRAISESK